jgi:predicted regulator of Ras-like GTPase activity (Roadblock/LC7/MglB family)
VETERVRAMLEALYALSERVAAQEGRLHTSRVKVNAGEGHLLMQRLDDGGGLFAVTESGARTGLVLYDMKNSAAEIGKMLEEGGA